MCSRRPVEEGRSSFVRSYVKETRAAVHDHEARKHCYELVTEALGFIRNYALKNARAPDRNLVLPFRGRTSVTASTRKSVVAPAYRPTSGTCALLAPKYSCGGGLSIGVGDQVAVLRTSSTICGKRVARNFASSRESATTALKTSI